MLLQDLKILLKQKLTTHFEAVELSSIIGMLIEEVSGWNRTQQIIHQNTAFNQAQVDQIEKYTEQLISGKPIQYILGKAWFMGQNFTVNENVLIPRPETEELVEWIISYANIKNKTLSILDIGTGSGCISIALKMALPHCEVSALDISKEALKLAQLNANNLNVSIQWMEQNILDTVALENAYDIIVSNPPYIPIREKESMQKQVVNFEPSLALFVPDEDPLIFYRTIAKMAKQSLSKNGQLFFEIHYDQGNAVLTLLNELNFHAELRQDGFGKDRMIRASL
jgi:release factor glutamine methyltransferase